MSPPLKQFEKINHVTQNPTLKPKENSKTYSVTFWALNLVTFQRSSTKPQTGNIGSVASIFKTQCHPKSILEILAAGGNYVLEEKTYLS